MCGTDGRSEFFSGDGIDWNPFASDWYDRREDEGQSAEESVADAGADCSILFSDHDIYYDDMD